MVTEINTQIENIYDLQNNITKHHAKMLNHKVLGLSRGSQAGHWCIVSETTSVPSSLGKLESQGLASGERALRDCLPLSFHWNRRNSSRMDFKQQEQPHFSNAIYWQYLQVLILMLVKFMPVIS